jgi:fluoroquinolone transport system ATP-binding protein
MINVEGLRFSYHGSKTEAVRGIGFSVAPGEVFGFLGPSGAGKSTTQKILLGSLRGYSGSATVSGVEADKADSAYRGAIGAAFEFPCFYHKLTGLENLELFASFYPKPVDDPRALLERLGLSGAATQRVGEYSKGMKMRLNLARAVLHRPRALFLDEPTSGLDPANARVVRDIVRERAAEGAAVFLTTHDMAAADASCDRVAFLVDGAIVACDSPSVLKRRYGKRAVVVDRADAAIAGGGQAPEFSLDGLADNPGFLAELRKPGLLGVRTLDSSLDRIFLELTGREL